MLVHGLTWSTRPDFDLQVPGLQRSVMASFAAQGIATVRYAMATKDLDTVTGKLTLDANGDPTGGSITEYQVVDKWPPEFKALVQAKGL